MVNEPLIRFCNQNLSADVYARLRLRPAGCDAGIKGGEGFNRLSGARIEHG